MPTLSLRQQVILPFVVLVIFVSLCIGWVSIRAGEGTVSELTRRVLLETTGRIAYATDQTLGGAVIALQAVSPDVGDLPAQASAFPNDFKLLEQRFWDASSLFRTVNSTVYFGGADGSFLGVNHLDQDAVVVYERRVGEAKRKAFNSVAPGQRSELLREDSYDPRTRPWYQLAASQKSAVWTAVYNDYRTNVPVVTYAKSVYGADSHMVGVIATDLRLSALNDFLRNLEVSRNGVAFIVDETGMIVAASEKDGTTATPTNVPQRFTPAAMHNPLIGASYARYMSSNMAPGGTLPDANAPQTMEFDAQVGRVEMAAATIGNKRGESWIAIVAVPRSDFMGEVTRSFYHSLAIGFACVLIALAIGWLALNRVLRDIRQLTAAVRKVGYGEPLSNLSIARSDELGQLAQTFNEMEQNLRTDHLTGAFNREFLHAQIGFLLRQAVARPFEPTHFALLFIDLDRFKSINDVYGHDSGDVVLIKVAQRLKDVVRGSDVVARYGGDEFIVLLKDISSMRDVVAAEEKIRQAVVQPIALEKDEVDVGASLGWAIYPQDGEDPDSLLKIADTRMFEAKRSRKQAK